METKFDVLIKEKKSGESFRAALTLNELLERNGCLFNTNIAEVVFARQFTGKTDSENTDIYEGDIIEFKKGYVAVVRWNKNKLQYELSKNKSDFYDYAIIDKAKVIGNIYENIELIKER